MRIDALFLGLPRSRVRQVVSSIEEASSLSMSATVCSDPRERLAELVLSTDAIFINRDLEDSVVELSLSTIRESRDDVPVTLVYEAEPDGKAFLLAGKYDCWLFSERDRHKRTLSPAELGEALLRKSAKDETQQRLMDISLCSGPCSTGE